MKRLCTINTYVYVRSGSHTGRVCSIGQKIDVYCVMAITAKWPSLLLLGARDHVGIARKIAKDAIR